MAAMMRGMVGGVLLAGLVTGAAPPGANTSKPAWQRMLQGHDASQATRLTRQVAELMAGQRWSEARKVAEDLARLRADRQGKDHWQAVDAWWNAQALGTVVAAAKGKQQAYAASRPLA